MTTATPTPETVATEKAAAAQRYMGRNVFRPVFLNKLAAHGVAVDRLTAEDVDRLLVMGDRLLAKHAAEQVRRPSDLIAKVAAEVDRELGITAKDETTVDAAVEKVAAEFVTQNEDAMTAALTYGEALASLVG